MISSEKNKLSVLYSEEEIQARITVLANKINFDYKDSASPIVLISVLKGALIFTADLIRKINLPLQLEFVKISSYGSQKISSGKIETPLLNLPPLNNKEVLIVEDIIDSGRTIHFLENYIKDQFSPKSLKVATLLSKSVRREVQINPDYVGFEVDDHFLVGYGLDYDEDYRHLPYLAICN